MPERVPGVLHLLPGHTTRHLLVQVSPHLRKEGVFILTRQSFHRGRSGSGCGTWFAACVSLLVAALSLSACGGSSDDSSDKEPQATESAVTSPEAAAGLGVFANVDLAVSLADLIGSNESAAAALSLADDAPTSSATTPSSETDVKVAEEAAADPGKGCGETKETSEEALGEQAALVIAGYDTDADEALNPEEEATAEAEFSLARAHWLKLADTDQDGAVSQEERCAALQAHREAARERRMGKALELFDLDGDGQLSDEEKTAMRASRKAHKDARKALLDQARAQFDADGDGVLSEAEREAMRTALMAAHKEKIAERMKAADTNGDGVLDESERKAAQQARAARPPRP